MSSSRRTVFSMAPETRIANRYVVLGPLGKGAMGSVYRVRDESTQRVVALKRWLPGREADQSRRRAFFEREYFTLLQLSHPCIIQVYDYAMHQGAPFYTMELLEGADLLERAPIPWNETCRILRDIASSLALMHSRGLIHRDVTPRNIRCTADGRAKLLDFGAMATMDARGRLMGTPPFVPPEAVQGRPLDARADLYALGGVAYWLLLGRNAYPARRVGELHDIWRSPVTPVSSWLKDIPEALDELVLSLLSLDPRARPASAAEIIDRLSAVAGLDAVSDHSVAAAQLLCPKLIGRQHMLTEARRLLLQDAPNGGAVILVESDAGLGRSRMLQELQVEARLAGAVVLSAAATAGQDDPFRVLKALTEQLLLIAPQRALRTAEPWAPVLCHALPVLRERLPNVALTHFADSETRETALQTALREWFVELSKKGLIVLAVDDFHHCDHDTAALLAALGKSPEVRQFAVMASVLSGASGGPTAAVDMLAQGAVCFHLQPLDADDTEKLLRSVFGDVPNLKRLTHWVYGVALGNPAASMELIRHLIENGHVRQADGVWVLPDEFDTRDLPIAIGEAFEARIEQLDADSSWLAEALCLTDEILSLDEYAILMDSDERPALFQAIDALVRAGILVERGDGYAFRQQGIREALVRGIEPSQRRLLHCRVAAVFESRIPHNIEAGIHAARHLLEGGQSERGIDLAVACVKEILGMGTITGGRTSYKQIAKCFEAALGECDRTGRPLKDVFTLRLGLIGLAALYDTSLLRHADVYEEQLCKDTGLVYWDRADNGFDDREKARRCLAMAQSCYDTTADTQRVFDPASAVQELAQYVAMMTGVYRIALDVPQAERLPLLVAPFRFLSPAVEVVYQAAMQSLEEMQGKADKAEERRLELLEQLATEDRVQGLNELARSMIRFLLMYHTALHRSRRGGGDALGWADRLAEHPMFQLPAWQVRMLTHLHNGEAAQAEKSREQMEILSVQFSRHMAHEAVGLPMEAAGQAMVGDGLRLKKCVERLGRKAETHVGWLPFHKLAQAQYHRLCGNLELAQREIAQALSSVRVGQHAAWAAVVAAHAHILVERGCAAQAKQVALVAVRDAEANQQGVLEVQALGAALAEAEALLGEHDAAATRVERLIQQAKAHALGGVPLGVLYETGVKLALLANQQKTYRQYMRALADLYRGPGKNPSLMGRCERLTRKAHQASLSATERFWLTRWPRLGRQRVDTRRQLSRCASPTERSNRALEMIVQRSGAMGGFLFYIRSGRLSLSASRSTARPPEGLWRELQSCVDTERKKAEDITATDSTADDPEIDNTQWISSDNEIFQLLLLRAHDQGQDGVVGAVALAGGQEALGLPDWDFLGAVGQVLFEKGDVDRVGVA